VISVVFFDLGLTLVDSRNRPFPHVKEALRIIQSFTTAEGKPLVLGLISDFDLPTPPTTPAKVAAIWDRYLTILNRTGLRPFFEPTDRRVTLSTHAGVLKPDRKVFETALRRLRSKAALKECLLVTENPDHVRAARTSLHMSALQFRSRESSEFDFDDWLQAPPMIAHLVDPAGGPNAEAALRGHLSLSYGFDLHAMGPSKPGGATAVRGTLWKPVGASAGHDLANVHAPFTVEGEVTTGPAGEIRGVRLAEPASTDVGEAAALMRSLARHGQIRGAAPQPVDVATHDIETDDQGRRKLVRKRFRAV
jgi:hypothetical protein